MGRKMHQLSQDQGMSALVSEKRSGCWPEPEYSAAVTSVVFFIVFATALAQTLPSSAQARECSPFAAWMWPSGTVEGKRDVTMQVLVGLH